MQRLVVKGKKSLSGTVKISGSKNATLPILAASILSDKKIELNMIETPIKNQFSYIVSDSKLKSTGFQSKDLLNAEIPEYMNSPL